MIKEFYRTNTENIQIFPLVAGNSSSTRPAYIYTLVKLYNKANIYTLLIHKHDNGTEWQCITDCQI